VGREKPRECVGSKEMNINIILEEFYKENGEGSLLLVTKHTLCG